MINSESSLYNESSIYILKIDSIKKEFEIHENKRRNEEQKLARINELKDSRDLKKIKQKVRVLYNELLSFKDKDDSHYYGFGIRYKYNRWLREVQTLKNSPEAVLLITEEYVVGDLEMLGLEYVYLSGGENEYTRWVRQKFNN